MGADVEGTIFVIVTCARALKALGEGGSGATSDGNVEETSGSQDNGTIVVKLHDERPIDRDSIFVQAIFGVDGSKRGGSIRWSWRG